jgi:hypothetical protein
MLSVKMDRISKLIFVLLTIILITVSSTGCLVLHPRMCQTVPKVKGKLTIGGKPLSSVYVWSTANIDDDACSRCKSRRFITDNNGYFELPGHEKFSLIRFIPPGPTIFAVNWTLCVDLNDEGKRRFLIEHSGPPYAPEDCYIECDLFLDDENACKISDYEY